MSVLLTVASAARLGALGAVVSLLGVGVSVQAHHVPGDDHTGVTLSVDPASPSRSRTSPTSRGIKAMYATRAEAEAAAPQFGCQGAHPMGQQWMPCSAHNHGVKAGE